MATRDLSAWFGDGALDYPGVPSTAFPGGKTYTVPAPVAKTGVYFAAIAELGIRKAAGEQLDADDLAKIVLDDGEEQSFYQRVLGTAYGEMLADGVSWPMLQHIGNDAYLCFGLDENIADAALASLGKQAALTNRATRRKASSTKRTKPSTDGSNSTPQRMAIPVQTPSRTSTQLSTGTPTPGGAAKTA